MSDFIVYGMNTLCGFYIGIVLMILVSERARYIMMSDKKIPFFLKDLAIMVEYRRVRKVEKEYSLLDKKVNLNSIILAIGAISIKYKVNIPNVCFNKPISDFSGWYNRETKELSVNDNSLLTTCHEMAHHILNENNIEDGHGEVFVYQFKSICDYIKGVLS